jgi:large subunit ribosomal protein L4e
MKAQTIKIDIMGNDEKKIKDIELPSIFNSPIRKDIIIKVYECAKKQQPYGAYIIAGKQAAASSKQSHRRHKYKTLYGHGISRIPRKVMTRRGETFFWRGAFISGTVGGMAAHPPKPIKRKLKINNKERKLAISGAIAATASKEFIEKKYKIIKTPSILPIIIDSSILNQKPKDIIKLFSELINKKITSKRKVRAGKGKMRGRKYKKISKILLIISNEEKEKVRKLKNYSLDISQINQLNISILAPGGEPGRITIWTEKAIEGLRKIK